MSLLDLFRRPSPPAASPRQPPTFEDRITEPNVTSGEITHTREIYVGVPVREAGEFVTHETALRVAAVWACVTVISKAIASSDWHIIETINGRRSFRDDMIAWRLLNVRPNPEMSAFNFRDAACIVALLTGDFFAEIERDMGRRPVALWPIAPDRVSLERDMNARMFYRVRNMNGEDTILSPSDMFHVRGPTPDGLIGFDTVAFASRTIGHALAAERFGNSFYSNGLNTGGILSTEAELADDQIVALREAVKRQHGGASNAHGFMVLSGGLKFERMSVVPVDAQYIETRYYLIEEICRWFGVPPHKVQHLLRSTFSNIEHQGLEFVRDALTPWAERFRQEADYKLLPFNVAGTQIRTRIDIEWLAEGDAKTRAESDSILVREGIMTRNEIRQRRGLNAHDSDVADMLTVQAQMVSLDAIVSESGGTVTPPASDPAPPAAGAARGGLDAGERVFLRTAWARVLRRERARVADKAKRCRDKGEFVAWVDEFFLKHAEYMTDQLSPLLETLQRFDDAANRLGRLMAEHIEEAKNDALALYDGEEMQSPDIAAVSWFDTTCREFERVD